MDQKITNRRSLWLLVLLVLLLAAQLALIQFGPDVTRAVAFADAAQVEDNGTARGSAQLAPAEGTGTPGADASGTADASSRAAQVRATGATDAAVDPSATRHAIEVRAATVSVNAATKTDSRLAAIARRVDADVATQGGRTVAARLAARFGTTATELRAEQAASGASWGQLMIAHALAEKAGPPVTAEQLIAMHEDGMGWGRIAAGLGIKLGAAVRGVRASAHAAQGVAKADGHVSATRGSCARAGAHGGVRGGLVAANVRAGVGAGVGAGMGRGLKLGH